MVVRALQNEHKKALAQFRRIRSCRDNLRLEWRGTAYNADLWCASCGYVHTGDGQLIDWHDTEQIAWQKISKRQSTIISNPMEVAQ